MQGYSDNYLRLVFNGSPDLEGKLCRVKVTKAGVNECEGELLSVMDHGLKAVPSNSNSGHTRQGFHFLATGSGILVV